MEADFTVTLTFSGNEADENLIDLYDISKALEGFQRTLALTTHLVLNDQIITQAPSARGFRVYSLPPEDGSWKAVAGLVITLSGGIYAFGTASPDTPLGHLARSAYDYVISETLGFHVDWDTTLGRQYDELKENGSDAPILHQHRFDSLIEKTENSVAAMHRPIVNSKTADRARIEFLEKGRRYPLSSNLSKESYDYIDITKVSDLPVNINGRVSSYNSNTYKGRIFVPDYGRPVPFELRDEARKADATERVLNSLNGNRQYQYNRETSAGFITVRAFVYTSRNGRVKGLNIVDID